jgi:hypothetical protein
VMPSVLKKQKPLYVISSHFHEVYYFVAMSIA